MCVTSSSNESAYDWKRHPPPTTNHQPFASPFWFSPRFLSEDGWFSRPWLVCNTLCCTLPLSRILNHSSLFDGRQLLEMCFFFFLSVVHAGRHRAPLSSRKVASCIFFFPLDRCTKLEDGRDFGFFTSAEIDRWFMSKYSQTWWQSRIGCLLLCVIFKHPPKE